METFGVDPDRVRVVPSGSTAVRRSTAPVPVAVGCRPPGPPVRPGPRHGRAPQGPPGLVRAFDARRGRPSGPGPGHRRSGRVGGGRPGRGHRRRPPPGPDRPAGLGRRRQRGPPAGRRRGARLPVARTRASGSRPSRPWPRACRWWPPRPAPCPRWSATPPSWSRRATPTPWPRPGPGPRDRRRTGPADRGRDAAGGRFHLGALRRGPGRAVPGCRRGPSPGA